MGPRRVESLRGLWREKILAAASSQLRKRRGCGVPQALLTIETNGPGLYEFTDAVTAFVRNARVRAGLCTLFVRHTSCSLLIQENADPDVRADLAEFFRRLAPEGLDWIRHRAEGPDDMPAHIRAALTAVSIGVPIAEGRLALGAWQGVFLFEHRRQSHRREVVAHVSV